MKEQVLYIMPDGMVEVIGDAPPEVAAMGEPRRERASSIVPLHLGKRIAFLLLRAIFGERGLTAEWTREWQGPWLCSIYGSGISFVCDSRASCVEWEHEQLAKMREG